MHELSLIADLMRKINHVARQQNSGHVVGVRVKLGALAHISADHFREHFIEGAKGTPAEGARLEIDLSDDMTDPHAQDIWLESVEVAA